MQTLSAEPGFASVRSEWKQRNLEALAQLQSLCEEHRELMMVNVVPMTLCRKETPLQMESLDQEYFLY